jgi:alpha-tubulin suppressor-like RCC1 family protein
MRLSRSALTPKVVLGLLLSFSAGSHLVAQSRIVGWGDLDQTVVPTGSANVVEVSAGHLHNLSLTINGMPSAWPVSSFDRAAQIPAGLSNVVQLAAGVAHDLAFRSDGTVVAWGDNYYGQANVPPGLTNIGTIGAGGYHSVAVKRDGTLVAWGNNFYGQVAIPSFATNVVAAAAGFYHSLALRADGTVIAWGDDSFGQDDVPPGLTNVIAIAAGGDHCLALTATGGVVAWGDDSYGQSTVPPDLTNAMAVAAGDYHSLALRRDGTVVAWGPHEAATIVPYGLSNVVAIAAGGSHSLALVQESSTFVTRPFSYLAAPCGSDIRLDTEVAQASSLYCQWDFNGTPLPGATNASLLLQNVQTNQTGTYSVVVSNSLGLVVHAIDFLSVVPVLITVAPKAQTNFAGTTVNLSVTARSTVPFTYQWRFAATNLSGATNSGLALMGIMPNQEGKYTVVLGNSYGTVTSPEANVAVVNVVEWAGVISSVTNAGDASAMSINGNRQVFVSRMDGSVIAWRVSASSPLGDSTNVVAVAAGDQHVIALKNDGSLIAWGLNDFGQAQVPAGLSNVVAVAAGGRHSLALKADGTVAAWGDNRSGQTNTPAGLSHVISIATTYNGNLALTSDGNLVVWGRDISGGGDIVIPSGSTNLVEISGADYHFLALRDDGKVIDSAGQANLPANLTNIVSVAAGTESLALTSNGNVIEWGSFAARHTNLLAKLSNVVAIASGGGSLALIGSGPPHLTVPPVNRAAARGVTTAFRVAAVGQPPLSYQWQFNGTDLPGATDPVLTLRNVQTQQAGTYSVTVSNVWGLTTGSGSLSVAPVLINAMTVQPNNLPHVGGSTVVFNAFAQGTDLSFQWLVNCIAIQGATNSTLTLTNLQLSQGGAYSIIVSNVFGQLMSDNLVLDTLPLWIYRSPDQTVYAGSDTSITAYVTGAPPLTYVWQHNGMSIPGATDPVLTLTNVQFADSGSYSVIVSNAFGVTNGLVSSINVQPAVIQILPRSSTVFVGDQISFTAHVEGIELLSYQWLFNGTNLLGATDTILTITNATSDQTGSYSIVVSNVYGLVTNAVNLLVANLVQWQPTSNTPSSYLSIPGEMAAVAASSAGWGLAARADGTIVALAGSNAVPPVVPADLTNMINVAAGWSHGLALRADGTVSAWGDNRFDQTNVPPGLSNLVSIAAGAYHNLALKSDGNVVAWGNNSFGQTNIPAGLKGIVAIAAGTNDCLALSRRGQVFVWGADHQGRTIILPSDLSNLVAVASGSPLYVGLRDDRSAVLWQSDGTGETYPWGLTNVVEVAADQGHDLELLADGTLASVSDPTKVPTGSYHVVAVAAGASDLALLGADPPIFSAPLLNPIYKDGVFSLSLATQNGKVYSLEYKNSLSDSDWIGLPLIPGNGRTQTLSDPTADGARRFYRVRRW